MTHIFARFAIVLLIPLVLLCGRTVLGANGVTRRRVFLAVLVAGCVWNFAFAARLQRRECTGGAPASLMYEGRIPGYEYLGIVNRDLPRDAKLLLIGEARAFYFKRDVDYCVTFNRNPFFEAVLQTNTTDGPLSWLRERGYTHVLVNWSEVRRLASTYGFSPAASYDEIQKRFDGMSVAGLILLRVFPHPETNTRYVELYEVPH